MLETMPSQVVERLLGKRNRVTVANARIPDGLRVYAVGDIHGRVDLLERLHRVILNDARNVGPGVRKVAVYLGDYVDRGLHSREVIERLASGPLPGFDVICLRGNHDQYMLDFLEEPEIGATWFRYGGDATAYSYGVRIPEDIPPEKRFRHIRDRLLESIPARHLDFLAGLELACEIGDYLFVHAGIRPERPLERQVLEDLLWIREEFLESDRNFGRVVVHGHSVSDSPEVRENRIGIDTGACFSNTLTCLVLDGPTKRFLSTQKA